MTEALDTAACSKRMIVAVRSVLVHVVVGSLSSLTLTIVVLCDNVCDERLTESFLLLLIMLLYWTVWMA